MKPNQQQQQKFVVVRAMNNRQYTVPLEPNITFYDILKNVCQKTNLEPAEHILLFRTRPQDSSLMFRFSGIPNKAMLAMEKAKRPRVLSQVTIVLHCENGGRPSGTFDPTASLLEVLQQLSPEFARADANPLMVYMRFELFWEQLAGTTLENLGLTSGGAVIHLLQRNPQQLKMQANVSSPLPKVMRDEEPAASTNKDLPVTESTVSKLPEYSPACGESLPQAQQVPLVAIELAVAALPPLASTFDQAMPMLEDIISATDPKGSSSSGMQQQPRLDRTPVIVHIGDRQALLYQCEIYEREPAYNDEDDSFFELTVPEVIQLQKQLSERVCELESMPLMASTWREIQRQKAMLSLIGRYPQSIIRIIFPNRYILQGVFQVHETVADIENFVRQFLADPATPFILYTSPPKEILPSTATLLESNCVPRANLYFGGSVTPGNGSSYLQSQLMNQLSNIYGAAEVAAKAMRHEFINLGKRNPGAPEPLISGHSNITAEPHSQQQIAKYEQMLLKSLKK